MKLGIKSRLVISFISVIVIPVVLTLTLMALTISYFENSNTVENIQDVNEIGNEVIESIEGGFSQIDDYESFHNILNEYIEEYNIKIKVISNEGNVLFDSQSKEASGNNKNVYDKKQGNQDPNIKSIEMELYTFREDIFVNDVKVGEVEINGDPSRPPFNIFRRFIFMLVGSLVVGFFALIALVGLLTWRISKSIITPLDELNIATENITMGNLDFQINYNKEDELGRFCKTFNVMRIKLKDSLEKQAQDERSRKELIASISHDLRTPIASIKGYVEGLQDGIAEDKDTFDRYLSVIKNKTESLDRLIDDLFQFSQIDLDKLNIDMKKENSKEVLEEIFNDLELEFQNTDIDLVITQPIPEEKIDIDKHRIAQTIDNLVKNASKYVEAKGQIIVGAERKGAFLQIYIKDNGTGIDTEDLPRVFERFYRGEKSRSRDYGGTGLGLAICKYIVEAHNGKIWVESIKGKGSSFFFTLPIRK